MDDRFWMKRALRLAEKGRGRTSPNPVVGAVLVKDHRVLAEGYHVRAGEAHAEIVALQRAGAKARGATLYINLEPCTHYGKTPPCAPEVIRSGVKRVVIGMEDPNPLVKGRGIKSLRRAGLQVEVGVLEEESRRLNEAFCKYVVASEPFVILKLAATLDGKIATRRGEARWISSEASRRFVHRMRDQVDGVIVGVGTVLRDDPLLTARIQGARDPHRIILDSHLRTPEEARVIRGTPAKTTIVTTGNAPRKKIERLEKRGVHLLTCSAEGDRIDLRSLLRRLGTMGMTSVMVEGGSRVSGSFLDKGLVDKLVLFFSPKVIGDPEALGMFGGKGVADLKDAIPVKDLRVRRIGGDILVEGYLKS
jgi:diaminohydroxyphosphoribosylaminopyrimidine deaminase/5-amino-6-(5-phosphoribosylamino)uracil reductase